MTVFSGAHQVLDGENLRNLPQPVQWSRRGLSDADAEFYAGGSGA